MTAPDVVSHEVIKHRLWSVCERSHYTLAKVSGSPIVADGHEYLSAVHAADGEAVVATTGVLLHLAGMQLGIQALFTWCERDGEAIEEGDQFLINDPYYACNHTADMAIVKPVFWDGELIAWVASMFHTAAVPAAGEPGGMNPACRTIFEEGFRAQGLKIVRRGEAAHDVIRSLKANTLDYNALGLDHAAKIAANNVAAKEVQAIARRFGSSTFRAVCQDIIRETERMCRRKLAELPDGTWQYTAYQDSTGRELRLLPVRCTVVKAGGSLKISFAGTEPQFEGALQCGKPAALGHVAAVLSSQLFWEPVFNGGILRAVEVDLPEGTMVNIRYPAAMSCSVQVYAIQNALHGCITRLLACSEKYRLYATGGWGPGGNPKLRGIDQYGAAFSTNIFSSFAPGNGARPDLDGVDAGGPMMVMEPEIPNVETNEQLYPILYLWRRYAMDSGGPGIFRGGTGIDYAYMIHNAPQGRLTGVANRMYMLATCIPGLFGGYPGSVRAEYLLQGSQARAILAGGQLPTTAAELGGTRHEVWRPASPLYELGPEEVLCVGVAGGGGYGDPVQRDAGRVAADVLAGRVSADQAAAIYGVVLAETGRTDPVATAHSRQELRAGRLQRAGMPPPTRTPGGPPRVQGRAFLCGCGTILGEAPDDYLARCGVYAAGPEQHGLPPDKHPASFTEFRYVFHVCPGCGGLVEVVPRAAQDNWPLVALGEETR